MEDNVKKRKISGSDIARYDIGGKTQKPAALHQCTQP